MNLNDIKKQIKTNFKLVSIINNTITINDLIEIELKSNNLTDNIIFRDTERAWLNVSIEFPKGFNYIKWNKINTLINDYLIKSNLITLNKMIN